MTKGFLVTAENYPSLHGALDIISHDSGGGCQEAHWLPIEWQAKAAAFSGALGRLNKDELETFCIGEVSEQEELVKTKPYLAPVHDFLGRWFDGDIAAEIAADEEADHG